MYHIEHLPPELTCQPQPVVALSGLDTDNNSVHRSIWRAFTTGRGRDHDAFKFICVPIDHRFPRPKFKSPGSSEWSLPKGILKTGWMEKHLKHIPAVVAVFFDLDWSERLWDEKTSECAQRVETVRSNLFGRESKLVVILIQKRAPLPLGDDPTAMERAQSLCSKCDLPVKNLFVLSPTNHLLGCITRLENEFRNIATTYYHERAKKVKSHKDSLNKSIHQLLFVRHEFKIAFFGELKQDPSLALKHYSQAYTHLLEQRMVDIHLLEIKTVAGFINYKICQLSFQNNASDAISQFRRHIDFFSGLIGMPLLAFEHEAWMSKQFEILGDLFQDAIRSSLTALMTQHPGLYYQEAARHAIARRELCRKLCTHNSVSAESEVLGSEDLDGIPTQPDPNGISLSPDLPISTGRIEFYGQRPWRQGVQSISPPDPGKELRGIRELQAAELRVDHSEIIIPLLEQTHCQYQRYKADRMKLYPLVLMAQEYCMNNDYDKALSCYSTALSDYRREKWWPLYTHALQNTFACAYLSGQLETFISTALELIGSSSLLDLPRKKEVQQALLEVLRLRVPDVASLIPGLDSVIAEQIYQRWVQILSQDHFREQSTNPEQIVSNDEVGAKRELLFDVSRVPVCVECRVAFTRYENTVDQPIQLAVFLRSHAPLPVVVQRVTVDFKHKTKLIVGSERTADPKSVYQTSQEWSTAFMLGPSDVVKTVLFCVDPNVLSDRIRVDAVQLELSLPGENPADRPFTVVLSWHPAAMEAFKSAISKVAPRKPGTQQSCSLWNSSIIPSNLERRHRLSAMSLSHPTDGDQRQISLPCLPPSWELTGFQSEAVIVDRNSELEVNLVHSPSALALDIHTIQCNVMNKELAEIVNFNLSVYLTEQAVPHGGDLSDGASSTPAPVDRLLTPGPDLISIGSPPSSSSASPKKTRRINVATASTQLATLDEGGRYSWPIHLLCSRPGQRNLRLQCNYDTRLPSPLIPNYLLVLTDSSWQISHIDSTMLDQTMEGKKPYIACHCVKTTLVDLEVILPFTLTWQIMTTRQSPISDLIVDEEFLLQLTLANNSPVDLKVLDSTWTPSPSVAFVEGEQDVQVTDVYLQTGSRLSECQLLVVQHANQDNEILELGHYSLRWHRCQSADKINVVTTVFKLPSCTVLHLPLQVHVDLPATGILFRPTPITYTIENRTIYPQEVSIHLESSTAFMFSGQSKLRIRVLPGSPQTLNYVLLPIHAGYSPLPRFRLFLTKVHCFSLEDQQTLKLLMEEKILRDLPTHLFVVPQEQKPSSTNRDSTADRIVAPI